MSEREQMLEMQLRFAEEQSQEREMVAYEQGKADAFKLIKENWEQLKSVYRMNGHNLDTDMWLDDFLTEQLKEQKND